MDPNFDVAKLVGAASAPVALIIATCIYLSNLTARYVPIFTQLRSLSAEMRDEPEDQQRRESLQEQMETYERRIRGIMRASFWLNMAIVCFIATVLFTSVSMVFPGQMVFPVITATAMVLGLLIVVAAVSIEAWENHLSKTTLKMELTKGTPQYRPVEVGRS